MPDLRRGTVVLRRTASRLGQRQSHDRRYRGEMEMVTALISMIESSQRIPFLRHQKRPPRSLERSWCGLAAGGGARTTRLRRQRMTCLRLDDDERLPGRQGGELLAKGKVLEQEIATRTNPTPVQLQEELSMLKKQAEIHLEHRSILNSEARANSKSKPN